MKAILVISPILFIAIYYGLSSSMGYVDHKTFITCSIFTFSVVTLVGRYFFASCTVIPGYYCKYPFLIFLIYVDLNGINASAWRYLTKYILFFMWYALLVLCSIYLSIC